jgi:hypothetical protein
MFKFIDYLTINKISWEKLSKADQKEFSPFVLNLFLVNHFELISLINEVQNNTHLSNEEVYKIYLKILPKKKFYTKFIKKSSDKYDKDLIKFFSKIKQDSKHYIIEYLKTLSKKEIINILSQQQVAVTTIKKWTKDLEK